MDLHHLVQRVKALRTVLQHADVGRPIKPLKESAINAYIMGALARRADHVCVPTRFWHFRVARLQRSLSLFEIYFVEFLCVFAVV